MRHTICDIQYTDLFRKTFENESLIRQCYLNIHWSMTPSFLYGKYLIMNSIELKKEEAAFYFNQAFLNISGLDEIIEKQIPHIGSNKENAKKAIKKILNNSIDLKNVENYVYNFKDVAKNARNEIEALLLKLVELRNFYSHYVHNDTVKILSNGERPILEKYYQIAIGETGSENYKLEIIETNNRLTDAGVLFLLCIFLKKSQANKLISTVSGFKRNDKEGQPRRNLFTYYSVREGYKVVPDMQKHFLLFTLVNHLSGQDDYIEKKQKTDDLGKGMFFHRIASTFLNESGILNKMQFYTYQSNRLKEQRGELEPEKDTFTWIEPFQGNSYFEINGHKGVISEDEFKELCYALLVRGQHINNVESRITQFLTGFKRADSKQDVTSDNMLDVKNFPVNYFNRPRTENIKETILARLKSKKSEKTEKKAYDKMKEVMDFINNCLPADKKLKQKDYSRYLKMVRLWNKEKNNIKREFDGKKWTQFLPRKLWYKIHLQDAYKFARKENKKKLEELTTKVECLKENDFNEYRQINDSKDLESLKLLVRNFGINWEEKDWEIYLKQVVKPDPERQKLTIMKQRVTAELKKKHGIENLNLRVTIDSNKSRKAVLNRIAIPRGFVKKHIMQLSINENLLKKLRNAECKILLSDKYGELAKKAFENGDLDRLTQINGLYEKNKLIAFMVIYLLERLRLELKDKKKLSNLKQRRMKYKLSENVTVDIPISQYPSLVYAMNRKYVDNIDNYKFSDEDANKAIFDKVDLIEKQRMEFIKQVLGFEKYLFENNILDKSKFTDVDNHISFTKIIDELIVKAWDTQKLSKLKDARDKALHGQILDGSSFCEAKLLINELKKR